MALLTPILGGTAVLKGLNIALTNATPAGVWSSSDTAIAIINAGTGLATGVAIGTCTIIYTVGADSISETFGVYQSTVTNGFDITRVFPALQGRLGWHQPVAAKPILTAANKSATSGRYYDRGFHSIVTTLNYYNTQEQGTAITDSDFNALLQDDDQAIIMRLVNAVMNKPQLIEHSLAYTRMANVRNIVIPNGGQFCGYRINVAPGNYAVNIDSISLCFDGAKTFNVYLFNDLVSYPVYVQSVTSQANTQINVALNWVMNYYKTTTPGYVGGVWYIGYDQRDLGTVHALDEQLNLWADSKIWGAYPFQSDSSGTYNTIPSASTFNFNRVQPSVNFRSYGMNMEISSYRDYTQTIVQNAPIFDEARGLVMAIHMIEQCMFTTQTNNLQRVLGAMTSSMLPEIGVKPTDVLQPIISGLTGQLAREMERINECFTKKQVAVSVPIGNVDWANELYYEGFDIRQLPSRENAY